MARQLEGVKPGDILFVGSRGEYHTKQIVDKVGKLHVVCGDTKYHIDSGKRVGDSGWFCTYATKATDELYEAEKARGLRWQTDKAWDEFRRSPQTSKRLEEVLEVLRRKA